MWWKIMGFSDKYSIKEKSFEDKLPGKQFLILFNSSAFTHGYIAIMHWGVHKQGVWYDIWLWSIYLVETKVQGEAMWSNTKQIQTKGSAEIKN